MQIGGYKSDRGLDQAEGSNGREGGPSEHRGGPKEFKEIQGARRGPTTGLESSRETVVPQLGAVLPQSGSTVRYKAVWKF